MLGQEVVPGMIGAIQTHGELLHWHPHLHLLVICGAFTPEGDFVELPQFDRDSNKLHARSVKFRTTELLDRSEMADPLDLLKLDNLPRVRKCPYPQRCYTPLRVTPTFLSA